MSTTKFGDGCLDGTCASPAVMAVLAQDHLDGVSYDTMVGTGMSGALVVPVIARALRKNWLIVRKPGDHHHHGNALAQGHLGDRWIAVDDGMSTGRTITRLREVVPSLKPSAEFAGAYFYGDNGAGFHRAGFFTPEGLDDLIASVNEDPFARLMRELARQ